MVEKQHEVKNLGMIPAFTKVEEALERASKNIKTDKYSFGDSIIDDYCGGGWGRHDAYEMICVFGGTGMNKSTLVSQMAVSPALKGDKVAYLALEDEIEDVIIRMHKQMNADSGLENNEKFKKVMQNIHFFPENHGYTLSALVKVIEELFKAYDVIIIDPIQFVFEISYVEKGESEWNRQRIFVNELQAVVKKAKKTLVFVSHTNKSAYSKRDDTTAEGMIQGAGALPQISTKIVQIGIDKDNLRFINLVKNRFGAKRRNKLQVGLSPNLKIGFDTSGLSRKQIMDMEENW